MADPLREVKSEHLFPQETITERLFLRPPVLDDAVFVYTGFSNDQEITRFLTWKPSRTISETETFLRFCIEDWSIGMRYPWIILDKQHEAFLGMIEIRMSRHMAEVGFVVARSHWGKGVATEALSHVVRMGLARQEVFRVWGCCDVENQPSMRVMEKAGMNHEGILRRYAIHPNISSEPRDVHVYAAVK